MDQSKVAPFPTRCYLVWLICEATFLHIISGVKDLTLSFNTKITSAGWTQFALGMASSSELEQLALDHTALGDEAFRCMVVAMAACPSLEMLDLEETEITDDGAQVS